uniref:Uncharacterized protein n=1 Tax=Opuntia streptacantha TaxID=393608 RepID=A0A7C8ZDB9_OPUST
MGKRGEPDVAEFISALAGGNNAQLMVEVCWSIAGPATLALVAAAHPTGGRVVCIVPGMKEVQLSKSELSGHLDSVELVTGDPHTLLTNQYKGADFLVVDFRINDQEVIFSTGQKNKGLVVGYNAQQMVPSKELGGHFLPIGEGLLVSNVPKTSRSRGYGTGATRKVRSKWIVKVDNCTGEEHVFRVTYPQQRIIHA